MATAIPITTRIPTHDCVSDLIALHKSILRFIDDSPVLPDSVMDDLTNTAGRLRFDIAAAHAQNASDLVAKVLFFLEDHVEVGPCEELGVAMLKGVRGDIARFARDERLQEGAAHV